MLRRLVVTLAAAAPRARALSHREAWRRAPATNGPKNVTVFYNVFAAAHTGDCQAVRTFLSDPRGDVNMRDRHAAVLARTVLPTSWANPPVHPNANPPGQAP